MSINKVILIGNLGSDPEVKYLDADRVVANFSMATNESYTDKDGNKITQTEWHRIEMWDGLAKVAEKYLKKGKLIYLEGKIKTEHWTDKDGVDKYTTRIRANTLQMLGSSDQGQESDKNKPGQNVEDQTSNAIEDNLGDLPF